MNDFRDTVPLSARALLPAGMRDGLAPEAKAEAEAVEHLMAAFNAWGYQRVKAPLIEFEESLLAGGGAGLSSHTFRVLDPQSGRMMGLRPDMTMQIARIASTRLSKAERPLRLAYAGQVLRVKGSQLRPERQFGQVGVELIGGGSPESDAEVILMAAEALGDIAVKSLSIDLGLPTLVPSICAASTLDDEGTADLREALNHKDAASVKAMQSRLGAKTTDILTALLSAVGSADETLKVLASLDLPSNAQAAVDGLKAVVAHVTAAAPELTLTIDPVENRGFEYHSGVSFTIFACGVRGELGRGGHYRIGNGEEATGLTLFCDTLLRALPQAVEDDRVFLPYGTPSEDGRSLRVDGFKTVQALSETQDDKAEAKRLGCTHILGAGGVESL